MSGIKGKWWGFVAKNRIHQCLQWTVHFFSLSRNSANLGPLSRPIIRKASNVAFQQISVYLPSCFCRIREALGWRRILKKLRGFTPNNWCPCLQWTVHFFQLASQFGSLWPPFTPHYNVKKNWVGLAKHDFVDIEMRGEMGGKNWRNHETGCFQNVHFWVTPRWTSRGRFPRPTEKNVQSIVDTDINFWSKKNHILHFWEKMLSRFGKKREGNWTDFFPNVDFDAFRWDFLSRVDCTSFEFSSQSWGFLAPWTEPAELNPTVNWVEPAQTNWAEPNANGLK